MIVGPDRGKWLFLIVWVAAAGGWCAFRPSPLPLLEDARAERPVIERGADGRIIITGSRDVIYALDGSVPDQHSPRYEGPINAAPDAMRCARLTALATSPQWRHPRGEFTALMVLRARSIGSNGTLGPVATRTFDVPDHAGLPVLSIVLPAGALFDPDTGIYVVGNAIFHSDPEVQDLYSQDMRWWRYPGNYLLRGEENERAAHAEWFDPSGRPLWSGDIALRINGNNTRGFPQHALRMLFDKATEPMPGMGRHRSLVLRTAGNDQDKAFMRDALQHRLCASAPFEVSRSWPVVVYINGAYWGLHEMRERIDDDELALRHDLKAKNITVLADRALLYRGDDQERIRFMRMVQRASRNDLSAPGELAGLQAELDIDGFLHYMACQILLGNTDWPDHNVKYWRYTGEPHPDGIKDGRWRFIMGDSDLGLGYSSDANVNLFAIVAAKDGPVAALFTGLMRDPGLRERFRNMLLGTLDGPLSAEAMLAEVDALSTLIGPEMEDQCARWRRPLDGRTWRTQVTALKEVITRRCPVLRAQVEEHFPAQH